MIDLAAGAVLSGADRRACESFGFGDSRPESNQRLRRPRTAQNRISHSLVCGSGLRNSRVGSGRVGKSALSTVAGWAKSRGEGAVREDALWALSDMGPERSRFWRG